MSVLGRLMCSSTDSADSLREFASRPETPYSNVMLGHGISGKGDSAWNYNQELLAIRERASSVTENARPFLPIFESTWGHAVLLDPDRAAVHVQQTLSL